MVVLVLVHLGRETELKGLLTFGLIFIIKVNFFETQVRKWKNECSHGNTSSSSLNK